MTNLIHYILSPTSVIYLSLSIYNLLEQHYEVPNEFFQHVLGPNLKYSSCYYGTPKTTLEEAEIAMLEMYCERAGLEDGMKIIDLG